METVVVVYPDGSRAEVTPNEAKIIMEANSGVRLETPLEEAQRGTEALIKAKTDNLGAEGVALLTSAADALTAEGFSSVAEAVTGDELLDTVQEENDIASGAGTLIGYGLTAIPTGGGSLAARGALSAVAPTTALTRAAEIVGTRIGARTGSRVLGLGVAGALEGGLVAGTQNFMQAAITDDPLNVDKLAAEVKSNVLWGGVGGAVLGGGISALGAGLNKVRKAKLLRQGNQLLSPTSEAVEAAENSLNSFLDEADSGFSRADTLKVTMHKQGFDLDVPYFLDEGGNLLEPGDPLPTPRAQRPQFTGQGNLFDAQGRVSADLPQGLAARQADDAAEAARRASTPVVPRRTQAPRVVVDVPTPTGKLQGDLFSDPLFAGTTGSAQLGRSSVGELILRAEGGPLVSLADVARSAGRNIKDELLELSRKGAIELRPEAGVGVDFGELVELVPTAPDGAPLSWARIVDRDALRASPRPAGFVDESRIVRGEIDATLEEPTPLFSVDDATRRVDEMRAREAAEEAGEAFDPNATGAGSKKRAKSGRRLAKGTPVKRDLAAAPPGTRRAESFEEILQGMKRPYLPWQHYLSALKKGQEGLDLRKIMLQSPEEFDDTLHILQAMDQKFAELKKDPFAELAPDFSLQSKLLDGAIGSDWETKLEEALQLAEGEVAKVLGKSGSLSLGPVSGPVARLYAMSRITKKLPKPSAWDLLPSNVVGAAARRAAWATNSSTLHRVADFSYLLGSLTEKVTTGAAKAVGALGKGMQKLNLGKNAKLVAPAADDILANARFGEPVTKGTVYERRLAELTATVTRPREVARRVELLLADLAEQHPDLALKLEAAEMRKINFLYRRIPKSPIPEYQDGYRPSEAEKARFANEVRAIEDPTTLLTDLEAGTITPEAINAVEIVYPALLAEMRKEVMQEAAPKLGEMPLQGKLRLSLFLGTEVDPSQNPDFSRVVQQSYAKKNEQSPRNPDPSGEVEAQAPTKGERLAMR